MRLILHGQPGPAWFLAVSHLFLIKVTELLGQGLKPNWSITPSGLSTAYAYGSVGGSSSKLMIGSACEYRPHPSRYHLKMLYSRSVTPFAPRLSCSASCPGKRSGWCWSAERRA